MKTRISLGVIGVTIVVSASLLVLIATQLSIVVAIIVLIVCLLFVHSPPVWFEKASWALLPICAILSSIQGIPSWFLMVDVLAVVAWVCLIRRARAAVVVGAFVATIAMIEQLIAVGPSSDSLIGVFCRFFLLGVALYLPSVGSTKTLTPEYFRERSDKGFVWSIGILTVVTVVSVFVWWPRRNLSTVLNRGYSTESGGLRGFGWLSSPNELGFVAALLLLAAAIIWVHRARGSGLAIPILSLGAVACLVASGTFMGFAPRPRAPGSPRGFDHYICFRRHSWESDPRPVRSRQRWLDCLPKRRGAHSLGAVASWTGRVHRRWIREWKPAPSERLDRGYCFP
jgi:hypothetical protein